MSAATSSRSCATSSRSASASCSDERRRQVEAKAHLAAEERVLDALVGPSASAATRDSFRRKLRANELDDKEIEIEIAAGGAGRAADVRDPRHAGRLGRRDQPRRHARQGLRRQRPKTAAHHRARGLRAADRRGIRQAPRPGRAWSRRRSGRSRTTASSSSTRSTRSAPAGEGRIGADVSREGVQRDLLPLIEGTTVSTKHGPVKTDHILFIASGAFHVSKPSDLLPELQGRLPIRVELAPLTVDDFRRILTETEASLIKQTVALMADRGRDARLHRRRDRRARQGRGRGEQHGREHRRAPAADGARARAGRDLLHGAATAPARRSRSTRPMCAAQVEALAQNADLSRFIL